MGKRVMARLLKKVVAYAGALGELEYRQTLNEGEMKQIDSNFIEGTEYSASLRKKASRTRSQRHWQFVIVSIGPVFGNTPNGSHARDSFCKRQTNSLGT